MLDLYLNIKKYRKALGLTQEELARRTGYTDRSSIAKIEKGEVDIPQSKIKSFAEALGVAPGVLMGKSGLGGVVRIPVLGTVPAGLPLEAVEDIIDWEEIPEALARSGEYFALRIKGDSMRPRICDGDIIILRQQPSADSGDIVVATVNGCEATCKRLQVYADSLALMPLNPDYQPLVFSKKEVAELPVRILGKVVELRGKF